MAFTWGYGRLRPQRGEIRPYKRRRMVKRGSACYLRSYFRNTYCSAYLTVAVGTHIGPPARLSASPEI